jgi:membrane associated rhomboid family serine protease
VSEPRLLSSLRECPVTVLCLVVCAGLYLATTRPHESEWQRLDRLDRWGAVVDRPVKLSGLVDVVLFRAPLALWDGSIWRIPMCALHHVDFWHLLMNGLSAAYLGRILERRWGSLRLLMFLPLAAAIPLIPEFLLGNYVLGFSGVIAAMFGALCVLRHHDETLQDELPEEAVYLGGAMLAMGVVFTLTDLMPVANLAHMAGFFWGALVACASTGLPWGRNVSRMIRFAAVLVSACALWFVVHPIWDGKYHWYLAVRAPDADRRYAELRQAVKRDPRTVGAWRMLAAEEWRRGNHLGAWKALLLGLSHNPTDPSILWQARAVWRDLVISPGRAEAEKTIEEVFGPFAANWTAQFRSGWSDSFQAVEPQIAEIDPLVAFPLDRKIDLRLPELPNDLPDLTNPPRIPPEGDAVEGVRM